MLPEQLKNKVVVVRDMNERQTRQSENKIIQFLKTRSAQKSVFYGVRIYNAIPADLKHCDKIVTFKQMLKEFITSSVPRL